MSTRKWNQLISEAMRSFSDPDLKALPTKLVEILETLTPGGVSGLLVVRRRGERIEAARFPLAPQRFLYRRSEFVDFVKIMQSHKPGCYVLRDFAAPGFDQTSLFDALYTSRGLDDEIAHLCKVDDKRCIIAGTARSTRFTQAEIELHDEMFPIIMACCEQILAGGPDRDDPSDGDLVPVDHALAHFGDDLLTARESAVIHLALQGHSTESTAQELGISTNTAKHHRVSAYSKLGVTSQGELFFQFLRTIGVPAAK